MPNMTPRTPDQIADAILRQRAGITLRTAVTRILAVFDRATPADIEAGASWYGEDARALVSDLARLGNVDRVTAASVISHLSPRTTWGRNVAAATAILGAYGDGGPERAERAFQAARAVGAMRANVDRALGALTAYADGGDPLATFGPGAPKTRAFAANLSGDRTAVTVDVWAVRIALSPGWRRGQDDNSELVLGRAGVYDAIAQAYRVAARRRGVDPTTAQATAWVVVRNGRAA